MSSLKKDTLDIKSIMTKMYQAFKGQTSTPSSSVPTTLAITYIPATVGGRENDTHTEGEHVAMKDDKVKEEPTTKVTLIESSSKPPLTDPILDIQKIVPASNVVREDLDEPVRVPYMINGKMQYLTVEEINAYLEKEDNIKKAAEEVKMLEMTRTEVIKVVQEEAENIGLDPKTIKSAKAGEKFKKSQDDEHQVLKREHSQKAKRVIELRKKRFEQYIWATSRRLRPEPITDVKIHPTQNLQYSLSTEQMIKETFKCTIHQIFRLLSH
ncbi:hypothetical protein Tco_0926570 [Tanacetum coccineum]|uniref:Uncharacterized protein n=1 Tax=Tanacetum coccineum TaxID=301880 RepID=A0ABQ5DD46_9ASTR